jgi:hypothetical protein
MSESLVSVYVARGRTVTTGSWPSPDRHGPGTKIELPIADAARLRAGGFVQNTAPILDPQTTPNPAHIGPVSPNINAPGAVYRR